MRVLAGHAIAATGRILVGHARRGGDGLASYSLGTEAPTLVLDFAGQTYAVDPSRWAERFAVGSYAPSLILDFTEQLYAVDPSGWAEAYAVGGERPTMLLDFIGEVYGAPSDGTPEPPAGYALVVDENGDYLIDLNGQYLIHAGA